MLTMTERRRTFGLTLTLLALFAYPPGIGLPALSVEKFGRIRESSILDGVGNLFSDGQLFLGCIIGVTALVLPPLKMFGLVWLGVADESSPLRRRFTPLLTLIGRWGFLDLFVAGVLVAWIQLNSLIRFEPRLGMIFFGLSVLMSYLASICFDQAKVGPAI
jgi:paraquat-inducible protein A